MARKPPKPDHHQSVPKGSSTKKALEALNQLTDTQPTRDHLADFMKETNAEKNDRGAAILLATNVENALQGALMRMFGPRSNTRKLFGVNSPLGAFSNKIEVGYALGIFGDQMKTNLDIIRTVRNAFAHAKIPITFDTTPVRNACSLLVVPKLLPPHAIRKDNPDLEGRKRFQTVCNDTAHNLIMFSRFAVTRLDPTTLQVQLPGNFEILARHQSLP
jgi:hypothetical protein